MEQGYATFVWQERAQTRATQMTHMPSLKPLCWLYQNEGSLRRRCVICLSQGKKAYSPCRSPHLKVLDLNVGFGNFQTRCRLQDVGLIFPLAFVAVQDAGLVFRNLKYRWNMDA